MEELKEMCRVCMAEAEDLLDIYDEKKTHIDDRLSEALKKAEEPEPTLPDLLKECSPICVESDDPFPKKVCDPCLRKVREAAFFQRRYAKSMNYIVRVKLEAKDNDILDDIEKEEWNLRMIKEENEEEDEDEDQENKSADEEDEEDENDEEKENDENEEDELYEDEEESDDFEDDEDEYLPASKRRKSMPGSFKCPDCPKTFTTQAQLTVHSGDHGKEPTKQNGTNTRPKRRSAKY